MNVLLFIVIFILQIGFGITMSGYGRNKGVKQAVEALQKILEEREEVTIKLSDGRIKTFKATSIKQLITYFEFFKSPHRALLCLQLIIFFVNYKTYNLQIQKSSML